LLVFSRVELLEETFSPEPVLVEEKDEVFQGNLAGHRTQGEVLEDQLQHADLLLTHCILSGLRLAETAAERLMRWRWARGRPWLMHPPIY
jgi:hypothetical protein